MTSGEQDYPGEGDDLYPDSPVPPMPDDVKQELAEFLAAQRRLTPDVWPDG